MKAIFSLLVIIFLAMLCGMAIYLDPGYTLLAYRGWTMEMPLWLALILAFALSCLLLWILKFLGLVISSKNKFFEWYRRRGMRHALRHTFRGLVYFTEAYWEDAVTELKKGINQQPLINLLAIAMAHARNGDNFQKQQALNEARKRVPEGLLAIELMEAQLAIEERRWLSAQKILERLRLSVPSHPYILLRLKYVYLKSKRWHELAALLPALKRYTPMSDRALARLQQNTYLPLLLAANSLTELNHLWKALPKKKSSVLLSAYTHSLIRLGEAPKAELFLRDALQRKQNLPIALLQPYLSCCHENPDAALACLEKLLPQFPRHALLLLVLGKVCTHLKLWGKAKSYLEQSLQQQSSPDAYRYLAELYAQQQDNRLAYQYAQKALQRV